MFYLTNGTLGQIRHSGLDPESSFFSNNCMTGCRIRHHGPRTGTGMTINDRTLFLPISLVAVTNLVGGTAVAIEEAVYTVIEKEDGFKLLFTIGGEK